MTNLDILKRECDECLGEDPKMVAECSICGDEILEYEEYYDFDGEVVCDNCTYDYIKQFRKVGELCDEFAI